MQPFLELCNSQLLFFHPSCNTGQSALTQREAKEAA